MKGHVALVTTAGFSPDSSTLLTTSRDNTIKLWNAFSGEELRTITTPYLVFEYLVRMERNLPPTSYLNFVYSIPIRAKNSGGFALQGQSIFLPLVKTEMNLSLLRLIVALFPGT